MLSSKGTASGQGSLSPMAGHAQSAVSDTRPPTRVFTCLRGGVMRLLPLTQRYSATKLCVGTTGPNSVPLRDTAGIARRTSQQ